MHNFGLLYRFEMKKRLKSLIIWSIAIFVLFGIYMLIFPMVKDVTDGMIKGMPEEILNMFGMDSLSDMGDYNKYFATEFTAFVVLFCGYAVYSSASAYYTEENSGSIEYLATSGLTRSEIFFAKICAVITNVVTLVVVATLSVVVSGYMVASSQIKPLGIVFVFLVSLVPIFVFCAIGVLLGSIANKKSKPNIIGLAILFVTYVLGYLTALGVDQLKFMKWFSPIQLLNAPLCLDVVINNASFPVIAFIVEIIVAGGLIAVGYYNYRKKDL